MHARDALWGGQWQAGSHWLLKLLSRRKTTPKLQPEAELPPREGAPMAVWVQGAIAVALTYLASKTFAEILTFHPLQSLRSGNFVLVSPGCSL